jgi:hypothetical protein
LYLQTYFQGLGSNTSGQSTGIFFGQGRFDGSNNKLEISDVSTKVNFAGFSSPSGASYR